MVGYLAFDQAFDQVEHDYFWKTMQRFGLNPGLISMVKVLYQDTKSVLKIGGGLSLPFKVQRDIRQGWSLSGMLYTLAIVFLCRIWFTVEDYSIPNCTANTNFSAYADDAVVIIRTQDNINYLEKLALKNSSAREN